MTKQEAPEIKESLDAVKEAAAAFVASKNGDRLATWDALNRASNRAWKTLHKLGQLPRREPKAKPEKAKPKPKPKA